MKKLNSCFGHARGLDHAHCHGSILCKFGGDRLPTAAAIVDRQQQFSHYSNSGLAIVAARAAKKYKVGMHSLP